MAEIKQNIQENQSEFRIKVEEFLYKYQVQCYQRIAVLSYYLLQQQ